jgi:uncharacterized protein YbjT (DUF2867 family)
MKVAIAGGHGKIGRHLTRILVERGDEVLSLNRNPAYSEEIRALGAEPVTCDLEQATEEEVAAALGSADAVVFAAGAGPGSGPDRKWTMDHGGAVKLIAACRARSISRYLIVSSVGADPDHPGDEVFDVYLRAKGKADAELAASGLDHTIVRPHGLTDDPATGRVQLGNGLERGEISREDVAALLAACLASAKTIGATFEATGGETPIDQALASL